MKNDQKSENVLTNGHFCGIVRVKEMTKSHK